MAQCNKTTRRGTRCTAQALRGKTACVFHSKGSAEARRRGGRIADARRRTPPPTTLPPDSPPLKLETVDDVRAALAEALNCVRVGRMGTCVANAIGQLGGMLLKAMEKSDLERRIEMLEQRTTNGRKR